MHAYIHTDRHTYIHTSARTLVPIWLYTHRFQIYRYRHKGWNMRMQCYPHVAVGPWRCQDKVELRGRRLVDRNIPSYWGSMLMRNMQWYMIWLDPCLGINLIANWDFSQGPSETVGSKVDGKCQYYHISTHRLCGSSLSLRASLPEIWQQIGRKFGMGL